MFYAFLSIFGMLAFNVVSASTDSLHSINNNETTTSVPLNAFAIKNGKVKMSEHMLKQKRHQLRMLLMRKRSPSLGCLQGRRQQQLKEQLAEIDKKLNHSD